MYQEYYDNDNYQDDMNYYPDTEPGLKGDTATNTLKPATVESGATVRVPLFINEGETIEIDTRDGSYDTVLARGYDGRWGDGINDFGRQIERIIDRVYYDNTTQE